MKHSIFLITVIAAVAPLHAAADNMTDPLCSSLRRFVTGIQPNEIHEFAFHTLWGGNFKNSPAQALYAKRCIDNDYAPAKMVCDYLMEHGAIEFSGNNVKRTLRCLSPETRFGTHVDLHEAAFSLRYGTGKRWSIVTIKFSEDTRVGGMALTVAANGY